MTVKSMVGATLLCVLLVSQCTWAQILGRQKLSSDFIPENAAAAAAVFPKALGENPDLELIPHEIITAWGQEEFGFDPMLIEEATFVVQTPESMEQPPLWAFVMRFHEMQGLSDHVLQEMDKTTIGGKTVYSSGGYGPSFLIYDEATMFFGEEDFFEDMLNADGTSDLAKLVKNSRAKGQVFAFGDMVQVRDLVNEQLAQFDGMLPPPLAGLLDIPDLVNSLEISVGIDDELVTTLRMNTDDSDNAEELAEILVSGIGMGKQMFLAQTAGQMDQNDPIQEASSRYMRRLADRYEEVLTPKVDGSQVVIQLENEAAMTPVLIGMLLPAVQSTRSAARRTHSANNIRQLMLSLHNYESAHRKLPAQASVDEKGRQLLSWRVHVLPYLGEEELYREFHLDEPWDSPHNSELIERMPQFYMCPDVGDLRGKTVYLGVTGEGMAMGKKERRFAEITDGTSNTIMLVEVDPGEAQIWTKPADYEVDEDRPMEGLGGIRPGGFNAAFMDGSVQFISNTLDEEVWKAMLTIAGGEIVNR